MDLKGTLKKIPLLVKINNNLKINKAYNDDKKEFKKHWINSNINYKKIGYSIILEVHSLEKGMTSTNPRYFGIKKVEKIINLLDLYNKTNQNIDFAYKLGVNALRAYCNFYEKMNWIERREYKLVSDYIKNQEKVESIDVGSYEILKKDFINDSQIDYDKFLSSRHSVRSFKKDKLKIDDIEKAVNMAMKSPSACNRQMCKIYYIEDNNKLQKAIKYGHGLTNFNLESTKLFVITFDISSFIVIGDRHQGWFNAGLISMNFVNALHSLGIGSCFIQFGNNYKEERELKNILDIPDNEKIAVIIAAGYYEDISRIPFSSRKDIKEILYIK